MKYVLLILINEVFDLNCKLNTTVSAHIHKCVPADMMKAGFVMNIICVFTLCLSINTYAVPLFGLNTFPDWAAAAQQNASACSA